MSSSGFWLCCQPPAPSSSKAQTHRHLKTLPPPGGPTPAKGTDLITQALKCQTPASQVSVPEDDTHLSQSL